MTEPAFIPARVAYSLCAAVLHRRAENLRGRVESSRRRRGATAGVQSAGRQVGRCLMAEEFRRAGDACYHSAAHSDSAGVDAAVLGYLLAWLSGYDLIYPELRAELIECGADIVAFDAVPRRDPLAVCREVIG